MSRIPRPLPALPTPTLGSPIPLHRQTPTSPSLSPSPSPRRKREPSANDSELPYRSPLRQFGRLGLGPQNQISPTSTPNRGVKRETPKSLPTARNGGRSSSSSDEASLFHPPKLALPDPTRDSGVVPRPGLRKQKSEAILPSYIRPTPSSTRTTKPSQPRRIPPPTPPAMREQMTPHPFDRQRSLQPASRTMKIRKSSISYPHSQHKPPPPPPSPSYRLTVTLPSESPTSSNFGLWPSSPLSPTTPLVETDNPTQPRPKQARLLKLLSRALGRGEAEVMRKVDSEGLGLVASPSGRGFMGRFRRSFGGRSGEGEEGVVVPAEGGGRKDVTWDKDFGPAFGIRLDQMPPGAFCTSLIGGRRHELPVVVFNVVEEIFARGMSQPGLFSLSGDPIRISNLYARYNTPPFYGDDLDLSQEPIHNLTGIVKRFVRDLPGPVLEVGLGDAFEWVCSDFSRNSMVEKEKGSESMRPNATSQFVPDSRQILAAQILLRLLPPLQFSLLIYLLAFLGQLPLFPDNRLTIEAIGSIFGPALCGARGKGVPGLGNGGKREQGSTTDEMSDGGSLDEKQKGAERIVDKSQKLLGWLVKHWSEISDNLLEMDLDDDEEMEARRNSEALVGEDEQPTTPVRKKTVDAPDTPGLRLNSRQSQTSTENSSEKDSNGPALVGYDNPSVTTSLFDSQTSKSEEPVRRSITRFDIPLIRLPSASSLSGLGMPMTLGPSAMSGPSCYSTDTPLPSVAESASAELAALLSPNEPERSTSPPAAAVVPVARAKTPGKKSKLKRSRSFGGSISSLKGLILGRRGSEADLSGKAKLEEGIDEEGRMVLETRKLPESSTNLAAALPELDLASHEPSRQASAVLGSLHDLLTSKDAQIKRDRVEIEGLKKRLKEVDAIVESGRKEIEAAIATTTEASKASEEEEKETFKPPHPHRRSLSQTIGLSSTTQQTQLQIQSLQAQISRLRTDLHSARMEHNRKDRRVEMLEREVGERRRVGEEKDVRIDGLEGRVREEGRGRRKAEEGWEREKGRVKVMEGERDGARKKLEEIRGALGG